MFSRLKSFNVAKKKNIKSNPHVTPLISEKFKISVVFLKQKYISGIKKSSNTQKFWLFGNNVLLINCKNTINASPMKYTAKSTIGYFKKLNSYTKKTSKSDNKNATIKPKKVNLSALLNGRFIMLLPKIKRAESHTKWCENGFKSVKIIPLFSQG